MHNYLSIGVLPEDAQQARKLTLQKVNSIIQKGLLYFVDTRGNQKLCIVVPTSLQELLMKETHAGPFGVTLLPKDSITHRFNNTGGSLVMW